MGEGGDRRLAAIVAADVVGYSRMMSEDEAGTLAALRLHREELIDPLIAAHGGRLVKTMGDGFLREFASVPEAVRCALAIQHGMAARNADVLDERRIVFRIGVNVGDIIFEEGDIFGHSVNLAARLEGMAEPGGLLVSHGVHDSIAGRLDVEFADNGERKFKNISRPVRVWSWPRPLPANRPDRKPFVVVTEFEGRREEERELAKDFRDELVAALARLTGLEVTVDRGKADYWVHGGVRLAGRRCRISAQLVAVEDERQLWAERYDEDSDDPFEILDHCVPRMAMSVRRRIAADDAAKLSDKSLDEMTLEQILSAAGVSFFTPTQEGWRTGGRIAEKALEKDPENFMALAMAAAGLGMDEWLYGFRKPAAAVVALALRRTEAALRLTNRSDMLHVVHALLLLYARRRQRDAAAAAQRALELNRDYNMGLWMLGAAQVFAGEPDAGAEAAARAVDIDIRDPYVHLYSRIAAYGHLDAERYDEAVDWFQRADHLAPGVPPNLMGLAVGRWRAGDRAGAGEVVARLVEVAPDFRLAAAEALPYRDEGTWARFADTLAQAGAPA